MFFFGVGSCRYRCFSWDGSVRQKSPEVRSLEAELILAGEQLARARELRDESRRLTTTQPAGMCVVLGYIYK